MARTFRSRQRLISGALAAFLFVGLTGGVVTLTPSTALASAPIFYENWANGTDGWTGGVTLATDSTSPAGQTVQEVTTNDVYGQFFSPSFSMPAGSYCLSAYIRWDSGNWPFVGLQSSVFPLSELWLIGEQGAAYPNVTNVPSGVTGWQLYQAAFSLPSATSVQIKDELWSEASEGGSDLGYFDGLGITEGACTPPAPPPTITFSASPATLSGAGGTVSLSLAASNATSCSVSSSPSLPTLPTTLPCPTTPTTITVTLPSNSLMPPALSTYTFTATANGNVGPPATKTASVTEAAGCAVTNSPSSTNTNVLALPLGDANPNPYGIGSSTGSIEQCVTPSGLTTTFNMSGITAKPPPELSPGGYANLGVGFDLFDEPFCSSQPGSPSCNTSIFGENTAALSLPAFSNFSAFTSYSLGAATSPGEPFIPVPHDLIYDVWLEQTPTATVGPTNKDLEVEVYLNASLGIPPSALCLSKPSKPFVDTITVGSGAAATSVSQTWEECISRGGTAATDVSIWPVSPAWGTNSGAVGVPLSQLLNDALGDVPGAGAASVYNVTGVSLGTEYLVCTSFTLNFFGHQIPVKQCLPSSLQWSWTIGSFYLESPTGTRYVIVGS